MGDILCWRDGVKVTKQTARKRKISFQAFVNSASHGLSEAGGGEAEGQTMKTRPVR